MSEEWIHAADRDRVGEGEVIHVNVAGKPVALYVVDGEVYATAGLCSHQAIRLCDGFLEGHEIECPMHQARFDIRTGKALCAPATEDIAIYRARIEGEKVLVSVTSD